MSVLPSRRLALQLLVAAAVSCFSYPSFAQECRDGIRARIVGGDRAQLKHWPGQAVLRFRSESSVFYSCGGSAISDRWVMTAAHCAAEIKADGTAPDGILEIVLGVEDLDKVKKENVFTVDKIIIREGYIHMKPEISGQDIALIHLKRPYGGPIARLSLEGGTDPQTPPGAQVRVAGFGLLKSTGTTTKHRQRDGQEYYAGSNQLLETAVPTVAVDQCKAQYQDYKIDEGELCAGLDEGGHDSCRGDSGGPLVAYDRKGCPFQVGVVSWGVECAGPKKYGVYTRVSYHAAWIKSFVASLKAVAPADLDAPSTALVSRTLRNGARSQLEELLSDVKGRVKIIVKGGNRVSLGNEVVLNVRSDVAGRLIVVDLNAAGEVVQLFPNKFTSTPESARVSSGAELTIPGPDYGFTGFKAVEPAGKGQLLALVVPETFPVETLADDTHKARGFEAVNTPTSYVMNLVQNVKVAIGDQNRANTQMTDWGLGVTDYEIVK
jgi:secreted trypsin-like serine protease